MIFPYLPEITTPMYPYCIKNSNTITSRDKTKSILREKKTHNQPGLSINDRENACHTVNIETDFSYAEGADHRLNILVY